MDETEQTVWRRRMWKYLRNGTDSQRKKWNLDLRLNYSRLVRSCCSLPDSQEYQSWADIVCMSGSEKVWNEMESSSSSFFLVFFSHLLYCILSLNASQQKFTWNKVLVKQQGQRNICKAHSHSIPAFSKHSQKSLTWQIKEEKVGRVVLWVKHAEFLRGADIQSRWVRPCYLDERKRWEKHK